MDQIIKHGIQLAVGMKSESQKELRTTLEKIFSEAGNSIDFDTPENRKGIMALASVFRDMFESVGNKKIDFAKIMGLSSGKDMFKALAGSANEMANVWTDVVQRMGANSLSSIFMKDQSAVDDALDRLSKSKREANKFIKEAKSAFVDETSSDIKYLLKEADRIKTEFGTATSWEKREVAALRYLNVYRQIMQITKDGTNVDIRTPELESIFKNLGQIGPYATQQLEEAKAYIQSSIQNIFNLADGKSLIGLTDGGAVNFDVAPRLIKTLDVGDVLGGKKNIVVPITSEIDSSFKENLNELRRLYQENTQEAYNAFESLQEKMVSGLKGRFKNTAIERLLNFAEMDDAEVTDDSYQDIYGRFVKYGLPVGTGTGSGSGTGDGSGGDSINDKLKETIALLEKEELTYEDILALVREYNNESKMKEFAKAGNWDEYDKIFAHHADIARKLVPTNMMGMGSDSPDKWLATVGMSAEDAAQRLKELYDRLHQVATNEDVDIVIVESNKKKIQTYEELSDAVSRYVELAKTLVSTENNTPEHTQIKSDMDIADMWNIDNQEDLVATINEWQTNINKIKAAIKAGADTFKTDDGYREQITDDTLSRAESKLRGYIYQYAESYDDIDTLLAGAKTKTLKNIITKELGKYTADQDIQKQQEEIAEAANAAALEEMEQIEKSIEDSALDGKSLSAWEKLSDIKYKSDKVDRYTQSSITDDIAKDLGIVSPHEEIQNNAKAIKSYEELCEVVQRYNDLTKKRVIFAGDEYPTLSAEEENEFADLKGRLNATRDGVKLTWREIEGDINKLAQLLGIEVPQAAQQAQQAVGGLNNELQEAGGNADNINNQVEDNIGPSAGSGQTDGATADEVKNLEAVRNTVAAIKDEVGLKNEAFGNEPGIVKQAIDTEIKDLGRLEEKIGDVQDKLSRLFANIKNGESNLGESLSNVVVNVNYPKTEGEGEFNIDGLKTMLGEITYKVKLSKSESDKNANKIELNEETLKRVLTQVFVQKPTPSDKQGQSEPKKESWALNDTLIKTNEILGQIQTNTIPIVESKTPAQPKSTLPETRLGEIKDLLSQINGKIVKGTKASVSSAKASGNTKTTQKPLSTAYSIEKKETQKLSLKKFRTELKESGQLTDDLRKKMNTLSRSLGQVKDGQALAKWNEQFKQFKLETDIGTIKDKYSNKKVISSYKELIAVQRIRNSLEQQYEKAQDGSKLKKYYKTQIEDIDKIIANQKIRKKNAEQEAKLTAMQTEQDRKLGAVRASKVDAIRREQEARRQGDAEAKARDAEAKRQLDLKQKEAEIVRELIDLWEQLGRAKANGDVVEEARLRQEINGKRSGLTSIDYATNMKFKHAKEKGFNSVISDQDAAALSEQQKKVQRLTALYRELGTAEAKLANTKAGSKDNEAINKNISKLKQQIALEGQLDDALQKQLESTQQLAKAKKERSIAEINGRKSLREEIADNKKIASANKAASSSRAGRDILFAAGSLDFDATENNAEVQKLTKALEHLDNVEKRLASNDWVMDEGDKEELAKAAGEVNKYTEAVKLLVNSAKMFGDDNSISLNRNIGAGDIKAQLVDAAQAAHGAKFRFEEFDDELQTITGTLKVGPREFRKVTIGVNQFSGAIRESQGVLKKTETFIQSFKRKLSEISSYFSASSVIFKAVNELKKGVQYVREIDLALTELKKVTDETEETYDKFLKTAAKTGARLGSTISAVTEATATFAKLGYSMQQASEMAEAAIVYKNVGDNIASTEDAADSIISTLKGFGLEASESMAIVDRFNEVGNRFAITSQGIGEALRLSASALSEGGNSLDESIGLITAANEVVNDPSSVGTALKTLTLRLRGSKTELEAMGEDVSDMATTTSQLQAKLLALTGGKVDMMLDANTFKNSTQILREMAEAWEGMNDIQRASALELMGGRLLPLCIEICT